MKMSEKRRYMMLKVIDDDFRIPPLLFHIQQARRCDEMLDWLLRNHLTGKRFMLWVLGDCKGSALTMLSELLRRLEHERERRPVLVEQDYLINARPRLQLLKSDQ